MLDERVDIFNKSRGIYLHFIKLIGGRFAGETGCSVARDVDDPDMSTAGRERGVDGRSSYPKTRADKSTLTRLPSATSPAPATSVELKGDGPRFAGGGVKPG